LQSTDELEIAPIAFHPTHLPELGTDLVTALTSLKMNDFSHGEEMLLLDEFDSKPKSSQKFCLAVLFLHTGI
jgi:hypothetical protein